MSYDYIRWMKNSVDRNTKLGRIIWPATHNSGSYNGQNTIMVKCQELNIGEQLVYGVRAFDIRVKYSGEWYVMHHNGNCPPIGDQIARQQYDAALDSINAFLNVFGTEEVVLIRLSRDGAELTDDQQKYILWLTQQKLGSLLWDAPLTPATTYGDLVSSNKRVLLFAADGQIDKWPTGSRPSWALNPSGILHDTWVGEQSSQWVDEWVKKDTVWKNNHDAISQRATNLNGSSTWPDGEPIFLQTSFNVWTGNVGLYAGTVLNPDITRWLREWGSDRMIRNGINIVSVDFINLPNKDLMDTLIQCNLIQS